MNKGKIKKSALLALGMAFGLALSSGSAFAAGSGDAAKGAKVFKKCKACHSIEQGAKHKFGPNLFGVFGRTAGSAAGYKKYKGLKAADWAWDAPNLDAWLTSPKKFVKAKGRKRTSMSFKLKKESQRDDVIAYLETMK